MSDRSLFRRVIDRAAAVYHVLKGDPLPFGWKLLDTQTVTLGGKVEIPPSPDALLDSYAQDLWVNACLSAKSTAFAGVPYALKRTTADGKGEVVSDHPLLSLLERPSPRETWESFMAQVLLHLELTGSAYVEKVRAGGKDKGESPVKELRVLLPTRMRVVIDPAKGVESYRYKPNDREQTLSPDDVMHFRLPDPRSEVAGLGSVLPAWPSVRVDREAAKWNAAFFERGAFPGVTLQTNSVIPPAERDRLKAEWNTAHQGSGKSHGVAVLPYGLTAAEFGLTHREMQFRDLRKMTREELHAILRTPPILTGLLEYSAFATAFVQLALFRDYEILPKWAGVASVLGWDLFLEFEDGEDLYLEADRTRMQLPDEVDRDLARAVQLFTAQIVDRDEARAMVGLGAAEPDDETIATGTIFAYDQENAVLTIDEIRGTKNLPPHPNREFGPLTVPELKAKHPEMFAPAAPPGGGFGKSERETVNENREPTSKRLVAAHEMRGRLAWFEKLQGHARGARIRKTCGANGTNGSAHAPVTTDPPVRRTEWQQGEAPVRKASEQPAAGDDDGDGAAWPAERISTPFQLQKARDRTVSRVEPKLRKLFEAHLDAQRAAVLALLKRKLRKADDEDEPDEAPARRVDISEAEIRAAIERPLTSQVMDAIEEGLDDGGKQMADVMRVDFLHPEEGVQEYLDERAAKLVQDIDESTASAVRETLRAGYDAGETERQLLERIATSGSFAASRAQRIARTELHTATQAGAHQQMKAQGVKRAQWIAASDARPAHAEASGQVADLEDGFDVGGETLMFPGDPNGSPENTVNCFPSGTLVTTRRGEIPIESVTYGDFVLTHRARWMRVVERHVNKSGSRLVEIRLESGRTLRITPAHKLYVVGKGWVNAGALQRGDELLDLLALTEVNRAVGEIEHPHPELHEVEVSERTKNRRTPVDLDASVEVGKEDVDVVGDSLLARTSALSSYRATMKKLDLRNGLDAELREPLAHHDLARTGILAVRESSTTASAGPKTIGGLASPLVSINPLRRYGVAAVPDGDVEESKNLGKRASLAESKFLEQIAERSLFVDVSTSKVRSDRFADPGFPCGHSVDERVSVLAPTGAEAEPRLTTRGDVDGGPAANATHRNGSHAAMHHTRVESVRQVPGLHVVYNVGVEEDMSYFAAGVLGRNCRCVLLTQVESTSDADLSALLDSLGVEADASGAEGQVAEAVSDMPPAVTSRIDAGDVAPLKVDAGRGRAVDYEAGETKRSPGKLTVGPKAPKGDVQSGVKEHLAASVTTTTDARGFHNARTLQGLPDVKGGAGTERQRAVALVSRAATGDRAGLEALVGEKLSDADWRKYETVARNFWIGVGTKGPAPAKR